MSPYFKYDYDQDMQMIPFLMEEAVHKLAPDAQVDTGRMYYMPVKRDQLTQWLFRTQVDRNQWRKADTTKGEAELVCATYSLLLMALAEQQRLIDRVLWPLALARVKIESPDDRPGHSMNGYVDENFRFFVIEPQSDEIHDQIPYYCVPGSRITKVHFV